MEYGKGVMKATTWGLRFMGLLSATARCVFPGHTNSHSNTCDLELIAPSGQVNGACEPGASRARTRYHCTHAERDTCRGRKLVAMVTGVADAASLPALLVTAGCGGGSGADVDALAGRSCLCAGLRSPRYLRSVRDDRTAARLRHLRSESHPRVRPGLFARAVDSGGGAALIRRRRAARGSSGRRDGDHLGGGVHRSRFRPARIHHRASLEADPLWLHEWDRAHGTAQSDTEAVWLLH